MTIKKKLLLTSALVAAFATTASAAEKTTVSKKKEMHSEKTSAEKMHHSPITVTVGGSLNTQVGYDGEKSRFNTNNYASATGDKRHKFALVNDTELHVKADGHAHGMKYGGKIVLNADTSKNKYTLPESDNNIAYQTMVYVESKMGRLEGGSTTGVYEAMQVNAGSFARATGGINGDTKYWWNQDFSRGQVDTNGALNVRGSFITSPSLPTNYDTNTVANAAKVSYMTPSFSGFKAGVTFIPDTEQTGTVTNFGSVSRTKMKTLAKVGTSTTLFRNNFSTDGYKNVFQGGLHYTGKFDKATFKVAALGELGKAKDASLSVTGTGTDYAAKRHNLRAWELGASATYMGFTVGGSYGDWGKSGLLKQLTPTTGAATRVGGKKSAKYWTAGLGYDYGYVGASLTYINSSTGGFGANLITNNGYSASKGKFNMFTLGVDYKLAPGFMPYAEISHFTMKDRADVVANSTLPRVTGSNRNSGNIVLAGTKLHF